MVKSDLWVSSSAFGDAQSSGMVPGKASKLGGVCG